MYILGAGGHAKVVAETAQRLKIAIDGYLGREACTRTVGDVSVPESLDAPLFVAIGDNRRRRLVAENCEGEFPVLVDPDASVSQSARIGCGTVVMRMAVVQADVSIGCHCIVNTSAAIDHECRIGDYSHISPGAVLCGGVTVGEEAWIGAGATVIPGVTIGNRAIVGAGTTVLADVPEGVKALGVWKGGVSQ